MNLGQLRADVRSRVVEPNARYFTDAEINRWLNQGYHDFCAYVQPCVKIKAYPTVAVRQTYDIPTDCFNFERVDWEEQFPLLKCDEMEFRQRMWTAPTNTSSRPFMYKHDQPRGSGAQFQIWPGMVAASQTTTMTASCTDTDTTITVASTSGFPSQGYMIIENEQIRYWGTTSTQFLRCERGNGFTTAAFHFTGGYGPAVTVSYAPLQVIYRFDPPDLSGDSSVPIFPSVAYQEAIICYATAIAFEKRKEMPNANSQKQNYLRIRDEAKLVRERESLDRPSVFMGEDPAEYMNWW